MAPSRKKQPPQVLLKSVVKIFDEVAAQTSRAYWQPRSAMTAHLVCMRAAGWKDADYETLMTVSGFGISFAYEPGERFWVGWVPPPGADERITRATGFGWEWKSFEAPEKAWRFIRRTLDDRKPIRLPYDEELVIAGYQHSARIDDRKVFVLCVPFAHPGEWWAWSRFAEFFRGPRGFSCARHTRRVPKVPAREVAAEVMKNVVQWTHHHPLADNKSYGQVEFGMAGMEAYASDIADVEKPAGAFAAGWRGCHAIYPQWTARKCTAVYLKRAAGQFPTKVARHIRAAAKEYEAAYAAWREWETHLGREGKAPKDAWDAKGHREAGAAAIRKAIEHEKAAIGELAFALATAD